jgi:pimeloyl-ACP methyl ester carboxylesterase
VTGLTRGRFAELLRLDTPAIRLVSANAEEHDGYILERLRFHLEGRGEVRGYVTRPMGTGPFPAILYGHSHGGRYDIGADELLVGREYLLDPLGPVFARAGYVTLVLDMPVFGERSGVSESAAAKALLWRGRSLFTQMLSDHQAGLNCLLGRPDVDPARVGTFGISMGCFLSYWLAAVDPRVAATAHLCCLADLRTMVEGGQHDGHGIYLMVPGLLEETDCGEIAGLVAPRPQLICIGEDDTLTPTLAVERALAAVNRAYAAAPERVQLVSEPGIGHCETPRMRAAVLDFFGKCLG